MAYGWSQKKEREVFFHPDQKSRWMRVEVVTPKESLEVMIEHMPCKPDTQSIDSLKGWESCTGQCPKHKELRQMWLYIMFTQERCLATSLCGVCWGESEAPPNMLIPDPEKHRELWDASTAPKSLTHSTHKTTESPRATAVV